MTKRKDVKVHSSRCGKHGRNIWKCRERHISLESDFKTNKLKSKSILLGAALLTLCGCAGNNTDGVNHYDSFDKVITVQTGAVEVPPVLLYPRGLYLLKDQLVAINSKMDTIFYAFSLPDLKFQKAFGVKGQGPNDFNMINARPVEITDHTFTVLDSKNLKTVDMASIVPQVTVTPVPGSEPYYNGFIRLTDDLFCYEGGPDAEKELRLLRGNGETKDFGEYPEAVSPRFKETYERNQAYDSWKVAKPDVCASHSSIRISAATASMMPKASCSATMYWIFSQAMKFRHWRMNTYTSSAFMPPTATSIR